MKRMMKYAERKEDVVLHIKEWWNKMYSEAMKSMLGNNLFLNQMSMFFCFFYLSIFLIILKYEKINKHFHM